MIIVNTSKRSENVIPDPKFDYLDSECIFCFKPLPHPHKECLINQGLENE